MKLFSYLLIAGLVMAVLLSATSCKTKVHPTQPEKNGEVVLLFKRTACYGTCPTYDIAIYQNGLLTYHGIRFTEKEGKWFTTISKAEISDLKDRFMDANFQSFEESYPPKGEAPTDLPSCIITYGNKTVKTKWGKIPDKLTALQLHIDSLCNSKKLQFYDK